jgi:hypothetical protein
MSLPDQLGIVTMGPPPRGDLLIGDRVSRREVILSHSE